MQYLLNQNEYDEYQRLKDNEAEYAHYKSVAQGCINKNMKLRQIIERRNSARLPTIYKRYEFLNSLFDELEEVVRNENL